MQDEARRELALADLRPPHLASGDIDITRLFFRRRGYSCRFRCVGLPACRECQCTTGCEEGSSAQFAGHMQQQVVTKCLGTPPPTLLKRCQCCRSLIYASTSLKYSMNEDGFRTACRLR